MWSCCDGVGKVVAEAVLNGTRIMAVIERCKGNAYCLSGRRNVSTWHLLDEARQGMGGEEFQEGTGEMAALRFTACAQITHDKAGFQRFLSLELLKKPLQEPSFSTPLYCSCRSCGLHNCALLRYLCDKSGIEFLFFSFSQPASWGMILKKTHFAVRVVYDGGL